MIARVLTLILAGASTSAAAWQNEMYPTAEERSQQAKSPADVLAAAKAGDPGYQALLASLYHTGEGVPLNYAEALRWYRASAEQNNGSAMNNLGKMHERGEGVGRDLVEALKWYLLASGRESIDRSLVTKNRDTLLKLLTKNQVAEARRRASEWRPRQ